MGNSAPVAPRVVPRVVRVNTSDTAVNVRQASTPPHEKFKKTISFSNERVKGEDILNEYPELRDTLNYVKSLVKSMKNNLLQEEVTKTISRSTNKSLDELSEIYFDTPDPTKREMIGDELAKHGAAEIFMAYLKMLWNDGNYQVEEFNCYRLHHLLNTLMNYTDTSPLLGDDLCKNGIIKVLLVEVNRLKEKSQPNPAECSILLSSMGILHNCSKSTNNLPFYREVKAVKAIAWYAKQEQTEELRLLPILSIMTLAYIVEEKDNDIISADDTIIMTILQLLESSLATLKHREEGFSSLELVNGLTKLSSNVKNSEVIVKKGSLKSLMKLMDEGDVGEQACAAKLVWVLSFSDRNKHIILKHSGIMAKLKHFNQTADSTNLRRSAAGALWVLGDAAKFPKENVNVFHESTDDVSGHVMISYQWDYQKLFLRIKTCLEKANYKVWMDVDQMAGSTLESMADAVEKAAVILICSSQKYKDSPSCRTEAEYSYKLRKDIVPVLAESQYNPDGWLGAIIGTKLYFDFTSNAVFDTTLENLVREIGQRGKIKQDNTTHATPAPIEPPANNIQPNEMKPVSSWSSQEVKAWADTLNLSRKLKTKQINGELLVFINQVKSNAPEFYFNKVMTKLGLKELQDIMVFTSALDKVFGQGS